MSSEEIGQVLSDLAQIVPPEVADVIGLVPEESRLSASDMVMAIVVSETSTAIHAGCLSVLTTWIQDDGSVLVPKDDVDKLVGNARRYLRMRTGE